MEEEQPMNDTEEAEFPDYERPISDEKDVDNFNPSVSDEEEENSALRNDNPENEIGFAEQTVTDVCEENDTRERFNDEILDDQEPGTSGGSDSNFQYVSGTIYNRPLTRPYFKNPKRYLPNPLSKFYSKDFPPMSYKQVLDTIRQLKEGMERDPQLESQTDGAYRNELFKDVEVETEKDPERYPERSIALNLSRVWVHAVLRDLKSYRLEKTVPIMKEYLKTENALLKFCPEYPEKPSWSPVIYWYEKRRKKKGGDSLLSYKEMAKQFQNLSEQEKCEWADRHSAGREKFERERLQFLKTHRHWSTARNVTNEIGTLRHFVGDRVASSVAKVKPVTAFDVFYEEKAEKYAAKLLDDGALRSKLERKFKKLSEEKCKTYSKEAKRRNKKSRNTMQNRHKTAFDVFCEEKREIFAEKYDLIGDELTEKLERKFENLKESKRAKYLKLSENFNTEGLVSSENVPVPVLDEELCDSFSANAEKTGFYCYLVRYCKKDLRFMSDSEKRAEITKFKDKYERLPEKDRRKLEIRAQLWNDSLVEDSANPRKRKIEDEESDSESSWAPSEYETVSKGSLLNEREGDPVFVTNNGNEDIDDQPPAEFCNEERE